MKERFLELAREVYPAQLVIVTKGRTKDEILEVVQAGARCLGENRLQEITEKYTPTFMGRMSPFDVEIHFIGKLQTNKVKALLPYIHTIHSVDSLKLAEKINKEAEILGRTIPIYLEMNVTGEPQKSGFSQEELQSIIRSILRLKWVFVIGLMCMGKKGNVEETKKAFRLCRALANEYGLKGCSMGMSSDYPLALAEGASVVRVGSKIFEEECVNPQ